MSRETLFTKIIAREIPADIVYEDDRCIALNDIAPQAPVHVLLIPKKPIESTASLEDEDAEVMGHLMLKARDLAAQLGLEKGHRLVINCGEEGGQSVDHLHVHLLGGRSLSWPPG